MALKNRPRTFVFFISILATILLGGLTGCDQSQPQIKETPTGAPDLTFAVMGDVPYGLTPDEIRAEEIILKQQIADLNQNDSLSFVMHVGDIKKGIPPCEPGVYKTVAGILRTNKHPTFIIPGDNEWNDCQNPEEAWKLWEANFTRFDEHWPNELGVVRQSNRQENFSFVIQGTLFIGINMVGGKVHDWKEWESRIEDDRQWIETQFKRHSRDCNAAVIFTHANPGAKVGGTFELKIHAFGPVIEYLDKETDFAKPILLIHGDGHKWIEDHPFPTAGDRITRVQVTAGGLEAPLQVEVRKDASNPFHLIRSF
ncbi:MAG: hypothetical protein O3C43_03575 [Verrucomicrobia bacterium]|nr:hypothetical protein [Verrucomicrobiota bacterium]MDA1065563.1 hypothetical protein [Verrucomicrobiota bacterium]